MVCSAQTRKMASEGLRLAAISPCILLPVLPRRKKSRPKHVKKGVHSLPTKNGCQRNHFPPVMLGGNLLPFSPFFVFHPTLSSYWHHQPPMAE